MRRHTVILLALAAVLATGGRSAAQSLSVSLFERYLESLRIEAGIPGISATILHEGVAVWEQGLGRQDLDSNLAASATTPYMLGELSQALGSTLVLKTCVDESYAELSDPAADWAPGFPDQLSTLFHLLAHAAPPRTFSYDATRFDVLTRVLETCAERPYATVLVEDLFERLGMEHSVPAYALTALPAVDQVALGPARLAHYTAVLRALATPYRVDPRSRVATRTVVPSRPATAAAGVVSSVRDLARFDVALDRLVLLERRTRDAAWTQATPLPTGLGWFVQEYNGEAVVWQFGQVNDGASSLVVKVPNRRLTLIMLANSDGLTAPYTLEKGDVTASLFARLFLRLFVV